MMIVAVIGIFGAHPTIDIPAFTSFVDKGTVGSGVSLGTMFPALFVTIACGAISGFHSLVASGTTSKQLDREKDALPIAYGGMLIECVLAIISVCAVGYIWSEYVPGGIVTPTAVFATGISRMCAKIPFLAGAESVIYSLLILAVSAFCLTSLDTATRLARYMFQEFWLAPGETYKDATGIKRVLTDPYFATIITVVLGIALGMTGYAKIWALFGASNQLLAALGLLAVAAWLGKVGKNNKMLIIPNGIYAYRNSNLTSSDHLRKRHKRSRYVELDPCNNRKLTCSSVTRSCKRRLPDIVQEEGVIASCMLKKTSRGRSFFVLQITS